MWNKEEFGDVNTALHDTETNLHQFDLLAEERQLNVEEKASKCRTKTKFWRLSRLYKIYVEIEIKGQLDEIGG